MLRLSRSVPSTHLAILLSMCLLILGGRHDHCCDAFALVAKPATSSLVASPTKKVRGVGIGPSFLEHHPPKHRLGLEEGEGPTANALTGGPHRRIAVARTAWSRVVASMAVASLAFLTTTLPSVVVPVAAHAESPRIVGQLQGSGLVFKDTLQIESFDDPKVRGVTLYISNFQRPITERLTSNFLQDPSYASVACARTGPIQIADNIATGPGGEEVFEESRSLLFKTLRVQRIYDVEKKTVVYVSFNTRLDKSDDSNKSRFKSSLCAVSLE